MNSHSVMKIFVGEKPVYFTNDFSAELKELSADPGTVLVEDAALAEPKKILAALKDEKKKALIVLSDKIDKIKEDFMAGFEQIDAAGGIVQNDAKEILFIYRKDKWDLPKGKKEEGENAETCAEREIEEETGVGGLTLKKKIGETYHIYTENDRDILKKTDWFWFTCSDGKDTKAQAEEDITEVSWIATKDIRKPMNNTYKSIRDIMQTFFDEP